MTVLLLHGLGTSGEHLRSQLGPALPTGRPVLAPDVRAHGDSPLIGSASDFSFDSLTRDLTEQLPRAAPADPIAVVGVSLGAALALRLVLADEIAIERLVLVRPSFTDKPLPPNLRGFPVMGELLRRHGPIEAERLFKASSLHYALSLVSQAAASASLQQFRAPDAAARAVRLVEVPRNRAYRSPEQLATIATPTTIVAAPRDPVHPVAVAETWHRGIRGSSLETLPARDDGEAAHLAALRGIVGAALA